MKYTSHVISVLILKEKELRLGLRFGQGKADRSGRVGGLGRFGRVGRLGRLGSLGR